MVTIKVYNDIITASDEFFYEMFGAEYTLSLDKVKKIFDENPDEKDFKFEINCNGGYVSEGLAIYDTIRTSGKNIYCDINGACHSMAVCLLLAAPFENRTANPHAMALIHKVRGGCSCTTAEETKKYADDIKVQENAILDIYADRTGKSKKALKALMDAEKERTADELLQLGFISKINIYNTNLKKFSKMATTNKKENLFQRATNFVAKTTNKFFKTANFDYADSEGNVLFSTESEEDTLAVGDVVTLPGDETGGTFTLDDGRVVTIVDNVVTEIADADDETENLRQENAALRNDLQEALNLIDELKAGQTSNYKPVPRNMQNKGGNQNQSNVAAKLAAMREKNAKK
jgi:ATP-dependent protease ClpP protease subunit